MAKRKKRGRPKLRIKAKTYRIPAKTIKRKAYTRKDGTRVKAAVIHRPAQTIRRKAHTRPDVGKRGRTPEREKWFAPKTHTGWSKSQSAAVRRRKVLAEAERKTVHRKAYTYTRDSKRVSVRPTRIAQDRYLTAGKMIQSLANVTTDPETKKKARADAKYFFELAKKTP